MTERRLPPGLEEKAWTPAIVGYMGGRILPERAVLDWCVDLVKRVDQRAEAMQTEAGMNGPLSAYFFDALRAELGMEEA